MEHEREGVSRGDPEREAGAWLERIAAADPQRAKYQEMAAEELITFEELREKLARSEETKKAAQSELESISLHRRRLVELERDVNDLVHQYGAIVPKALDTIPPEKKHEIHKTLRMKVLVGAEGTVAVEFVSGLASGSGAGSVKTEDLCS